MITITRGNPTVEEIAGLLVALSLVNRAPQPGVAATAERWRRPQPVVCVGVASGGRERRWRDWSSGWSQVGRPRSTGQLPQQGVRRKQAS